MRELNKDAKRRDGIIGKKQTKKYDIYHFDSLTLKQLETLFEENFIDPEEAQNSAPPTGVILEFMRANPRFTCHGYAVTPDRDDYRVSLEGVTLEGKPTEAERENFTNIFRCADDFECSSEGCYCWYD